MSSHRLESEGFEIYFMLGEKRSYASVAEYLGVSKRSVTRAAAAGQWRLRIANMNETGVKAALESMSLRLSKSAIELMSRVREMDLAWDEVLTVERMKKVIATVYKLAVQKGDVSAAKALIERVYGKPRTEVAQPMDLGLPNGLQSTKDVRLAADALLRGMSDGLITPVDAQRAASVVEAARKSVETEELARRVSELEETVARKGK